MTRTIYCSIAAQESNLGDIEIRRVATAWLAALGPLYVYTGRMSASYIAAFDFAPETRLTSSGATFATALVTAAIRRRAHLAFAPGPLTVSGRAKARLKSIGNRANIALVRAGGGRAVVLGRALRGSDPAGLRIERSIAKACELFVARDRVTAELLGPGVVVAPDLAFAEPALAGAASRERSHVVISLRGDRETSVHLLDQLIAAVRGAGLEPIIVTQVRTDDEQHLKLGARLNVPVVVWGDLDHAEQLARVNGVYQRAHSVVSDRLHALLFGIRHGALPIGLTSPGSDKLESTLDPVVPMTYIVRGDAVLPDDLFDDAQARRDALETATSAAAAELAVVRARLHEVFS